MSKDEEGGERGLTFGRVIPATEKLDALKRERIVADPITGQGDARKPGLFLGVGSERMPEDRLSEALNEIAERDEKLGEGADGGGKRFNAGKLRAELIPPEWEWALADVLTQGAKKYDMRNWEKGMAWSAMVGCMKRHINKFLAGERYDGAEFDLEKGTTGCHHLAMVAWNALALMSYDLRKIGENDLPPLQLELFERVNNATSDLGNEVNDNQS